MFKLSRLTFSRSRSSLASVIPGPGGTVEAVTPEGTSRRAFLEGTGAAVGTAAVVLATPKVVALANEAPGASVPIEPAAKPVSQSGPAPYEPVTAYVRNAEAGEVTVMAGQQETTYKDPVLVKRLLDAAR
jgi:hypothetical protein